MSVNSSTPESHVLLLTGAGAGAIAVVRICGAGAEAFLREHFSGRVERGAISYGLLRDGQRTLDDVIIALAADGGWADLNLHGGPWVVRSVMDLCERKGFVRAAKANGDELLNESAVDAGDLIEREMLRALPLARTELAVRCLLAQPEAWREFAKLAREDRSRGQDQARRALKDRSGHWLVHPPSVAIVGIPNAGKSTLANALYGQTRSITADVPGTTRDWVADLANINGLAVLLHDMPGFHETTDAIEREAIAAAQRRLALADLVLLVLDGGQLGSEQQQSLRAVYSSAMIVINKSDQLRDPPEDDYLRTTATAGAGIDALRQQIARHFNCDGLVASDVRWWSDKTRALLERELGDDARVTIEGR